MQINGHRPCPAGTDVLLGRELPTGSTEFREKCRVPWERSEGAVGLQRMGLLPGSLGKYSEQVGT